MRTIKITKENAEFIKSTATKVIGEEFNWKRTFYLPVFYRLSKVMIDCNGVSGIIDGQWHEYNVKFTDEAQNILGIY